jgi:CzcA family heavy metal efflux pump
VWIIKTALRSPYTFIVMSLLIALFGILAIVSMPTDVFPEINIPVVSAIWTYTGMSANELEGRVTSVVERAYTTTVNDIDHIESQTYDGVSVIKVFFHEGAHVDAAVAQMSATSGTVMRFLPPGIYPPYLLRYNAASVPILQLALGGKGFSEAELFDIGTNFLRNDLATVKGAAVLLPAGGRFRQVMVDTDPDEMYAKGVSATDVTNAVNAQSLILPAGTARIGDREYNVRINSSPTAIADLNNMPVKTVNGATVYVRDVAHVHDGYAEQENVVRLNGQRSCFVSILRAGGASTLDVVKNVRELLPHIKATLRKGLEIKPLFDQSLFVRAAVNGVIREGTLAGVLTGLMILLFLGSWRSTLIVSLSIPLSVLASIIVLHFLGESINVMTLGGLSLAVGMLVDDATVAIENIHRYLSDGNSLIRSILDGSAEIAVPAIVSTLCICIVFVPVVFLEGAAKYLFIPLAMAVVFAMLASYVLSRTLIPTLTRYLLKSEMDVYRAGEHGGTGPIWRVHHLFNRRFEAFRNTYGRALSWALDHRKVPVVAMAVVAVFSILMVPQLGEDFFPQVDAGLIRLHVRTPTGTRVEAAEQIYSQVESRIRQIIPRDQLETILDNIGLPAVSINLVYSDAETLGPFDGEILIALNDHRKRGDTEKYVEEIRETLPKEFPADTFFFQSPDIVDQIPNFGLPAPIDVQIKGPDQKANFQIASELKRRISWVPGAADVHVHQAVDYPELWVDVDRVRANQMGLTQKDIANSLLISLSSSLQTMPNYWLNWTNGVSYNLAVQTPIRWVDSLAAIKNTPLTSATTSMQVPELLRNVATVHRDESPAAISHYNIAPVFDVYASTAGRDLGGVARDIDKILADVNHHLPRGSTIVTRGQVETMRSSFFLLGFGMVLSVVLVYLLMAVNFQSWTDPAIILMALPGAFSGIVWMLFITQTRLSVPALMGAIMSIGVATSNSILLVTFANEQLDSGKSSIEAALQAGIVRLRPVLMTALAMIIGMLPMSLGLGEGGEQNAPLGRAVIGGLMLAIVATLFFVPVVFSLVRKTKTDTIPEEDAELLND